MISTRFIGQLGNQLVIYTIGKILSEKTGQRYQPMRKWLDKKGRPVKWNGPELFSPTPSPGKTAQGKPQEVYITHWFDYDSIDSDLPINVVHGYFQRFELFRDYTDKIRNEWLKIQRPFVDTDDDSVYIHCRRTDYVGGNPDIQGESHTIEHFAKCLDHFHDAKKMVVVTDNPNDPWLHEFHKLGKPWTISGLTWDDDFMLLASCKNMIMSQSTYSWWAGFLGRAEKIVCPMFEGTFWHNGVGLYGPASPDYPNLYVDIEPERWIWVQ
jgi:hypothetical protein